MDNSTGRNDNVSSKKKARDGSASTLMRPSSMRRPPPPPSPMNSSGPAPQQIASPTTHAVGGGSFINYDDTDSDEADVVLRRTTTTRQRSSGNSSSSSNTNNAFRRVQRVSRHAALTTKQAVWDSNELSIEAALSAVDQWEALYTALRRLIVQTVVSARGVYKTAKEGAGQLEHGLLAPVRDWILLPAFTGAERAVAETVTFLQSDTAHSLAHHSLEWIRTHVPVIGEPVLAPALCLSGKVLQQTYEIIQYPIPSKHQVRCTVDWTLNTTKWMLTAAARSVVVYVKRADANITRTLSHTQWKVLGSGPYATLDDNNKAMVIDHLCERYFGMANFPVQRYELAAHIKRHNESLYQDLRVVLKQRAGDGEPFADDEWLCECPVYYQSAVLEKERPFLLASNNNDNDGDDKQVSALWFRLPHPNGKQPAKDAPWICFRRKEQYALEDRYRQILQQRSLVATVQNVEGVTVVTANDCDASLSQQTPAVISPASQSDSTTTPEEKVAEANDPTPKKKNVPSSQRRSRSPPPTIAQWYTAKPGDVMVDQKRHAVSFFWSCPKCRQSHGDLQQEVSPPSLASPRQYGDFCEACAVLPSNSHTTTTNTAAATTATTAAAETLSDATAARAAKEPPTSAVPTATTAAQLPGPPPIAMIMRPTFWRFYGAGDDVRRATWFLDTPRNGLQPFDDQAQAVLEDAYLFLKWMSVRKVFEAGRHQNSGHDDNDDDDDTDESGLDEALLTVEVPCPDGAERLVQFNSLKQATAIQKGLGAAVALFKRRVYRGAWLYDQRNNNQDNDGTTVLLMPEDVTEQQRQQRAITVQEAIAKATENNGSLGETNVPDASIRSILAPPSPLDNDETRVVLYQAPDVDSTLAVPPERLAKPDMAQRLKDLKDGKIDHLCLIVHGIGEMLRSIDLFGLSLPDLTSVCGSMRNNHAEVLDANFAQMYPTADATSRASTGRVEYLPVEWHESFSILTQRRAPSVEKGEKPNVMMKDISLRTIPNMREFANDTLMDVLFFMSPEHHDVIIDVVTHECNLVVEKFRETTGFSGPISLVGHSLGSIIAWDILNNQNIGFSDSPEPPLRSVASVESIGTGYYSSYSQSERSDTPEVTSSIKAPQERSTYPQLDFTVDNFFLLGSPVAVFLMIRNQRTPLSDDFYLRGCHRVFNIFHPYDPVAYRIEPCIDPRNADFEPTIIKHWNGGFRVQYQTRRLWRKFVETTSKTQRNVVEAFEQSMAGLGLLDATVDAGTDDDTGSEASHVSDNHCVITGLLNQGRRIDYLLQEREIENANEYVAALAAHSSYWMEKDLSLFIARQIYLSTHEHAAAEGDATELHGSWESISPEDIKM